MGTNYYLKLNACELCGHDDDPIHIGKESYGWKFIFDPYFGSWKSWQKALQENDGKIFNEYGDKISFREFQEMVERKQLKDGTHFLPGEQSHETLDEDGYRIFKSRDFS